MSYSASASIGFTVRRPGNSSRKAIPHSFFGSAAITCLVVGCAWAVYANVFGAGIYPTISGDNFDVPVIKRPATVAVKNARQAGDNGQLALLDPAPLTLTSKTTPPGPSLTFADRFAAAAAQGVEPSRLPTVAGL